MSENCDSNKVCYFITEVLALLVVTKDDLSLELIRYLLLEGHYIWSASAVASERRSAFKYRLQRRVGHMSENINKLQCGLCGSVIGQCYSNKK